jgi:EEF1A lysine methyltransferase 1
VLITTLYVQTTNIKIIQTVKQLLKPESGKLILLTSPAIQEVLDKLYIAPPIGPLRRTKMDPEHGELANEFACWGSWNGAEDFGAEESPQCVFIET